MILPYEAGQMGGCAFFFLQAPPTGQPIKRREEYMSENNELKVKNVNH